MDYDERIEITTRRSYKVVKANEIIQKARYDLNLQELKVVAYIISMIKPDSKKGDIYVFDIIDYCKVCGIDYDNGNNYIQLKKIIKNLRDKSFWITQENGDETLISWTEKVWISRKSGKIRIKLDSDLENYLIGLVDNYTQYELISTLPMSSKYSIRLYELLKSYAFTGKHTFDIDNIKVLLNAQHYTNFKDFRRYVLETATKEINLYTDIEIAWMPIKKGRKVIKVEFEIKQLEPWERYVNSNRANDQIDGQMNIADYIGISEKES